MGPEGRHDELPGLTEEQETIGGLLLDTCGLSDVANVTIVMHGIPTTVKDGLAQCSDVLRTMPVGEVAGMIRAAVAQQGQ